MLRQKDAFYLPPGTLHAVLNLTNSALAGYKVFRPAEKLDVVARARWYISELYQYSSFDPTRLAKIVQEMYADLAEWRKIDAEAFDIVEKDLEELARSKDVIPKTKRRKRG